MKRLVFGLIGAWLIFVIGLFAYFYPVIGSYGLHVLMRRGGTIWPIVAADGPELSPSMRLALQAHVPEVRAGDFAWKELKPGFAVAELPVLAGPQEIDRILLAKVDPSLFRFSLRNAPQGTHDLGDWMRESGAVLVINGSYFGPKGLPDTPFLSDGTLLGPQDYTPLHGAFIAGRGGAKVVDLAGASWSQAFAGADNALVSYPMLIGTDGQTRAKPSRWLANRSFVATDGDGKIVLGTTKEAFFSLDRLGVFLRNSPLQLQTALNLDGGPLACQAIALEGYTRDFCGAWETKEQDGKIYLLRPVFGRERWALPVVIEVLAR